METSVRREDAFRFPAKIFFATHHKAGSVWFGNIFRALDYHYGFGFVIQNRFESAFEGDVFLCDHSFFNWDALPDDPVFVHLIRDPRDMLVSACFYHQKSHEKWLHEGSSRFRGKTYQQEIRSFSCLEDQLVFEMHESHSATMEEMKEWDYQRSDCLEIQYEEFIQDHSMVSMLGLFRHIGLPAHALGNALSIAYQNSLFPNSRLSSGHIRSGKTGEWKKYFSRRVAKEFERLHGDFLRERGYAVSSSWVDECEGG